MNLKEYKTFHGALKQVKYTRRPTGQRRQMRVDWIRWADPIRCVKMLIAFGWSIIYTGWCRWSGWS